MNDEFEVEPGYGEKREEALRLAGIKTFFIVKAKKPVSDQMGKAIKLRYTKSKSEIRVKF